MTILSPQQLSDLHAIENISFDTFKADYYFGYNVAESYYQTLANDGVAYGNLACGVVTNGTPEGQAANAYVASVASTYGIDMSVGNDTWLKAMWNIMQNDWAARNAKGGVDLTWQDYDTLHATAFHDANPLLPAETWSLHTPLTEISSVDPAAANVLWNQVTTNPDTLAHLYVNGLSFLASEFPIDFSLQSQAQKDFELDFGTWLYHIKEALLSQSGQALDSLLIPVWARTSAIDLISLPTAQTLEDWGKNLFNTLEQLGVDAIHGISGYIYQALQAFAGTIMRTPDPIAIDLNRDGVITTTGANSVYFDIDNSGMKEAVSWVGPQDGLLAMDINHNGVIDNASELFTSYAQLAALDTNHDGKIDAQDAAYANLVVWQDKNQDGISQSGELLSVKNDLFLEEIPVAPATPGGTTATIQAAVGSVLMQNLTFSEDQLNTVYGGTAPLNFAALALPDLRGYGNVPNLSVAMSLNPALLTLAQNLAGQSLSGFAQNFGSFSQQFDMLLYTWAGVQNNNPATRGTFIDDARKLDFIETMIHRQFTQYRSNIGSTFPLSIPAALLERLYAGMKEQLMGRFIMQTVGAQLYDTLASYNRLTDTLVFNGTPHLSAATLNQLGVAGAASGNASAFWASITYVIDATHNPNATDLGNGLPTLAADEIAALNTAVQASDPSLTWQTVASGFMSLLPAAPVTASAGGQTLTGTAGDDTLIASPAGNDTLYGLDGNDTLIAGNGGDHLIGGNGADHLIGGTGGDVLEAGLTGSLMEGGAGSDLYISNWGKSDYIIDTGGANDMLQINSPDPSYNPAFPYFERVLNSDGNAYDLEVFLHAHNSTTVQNLDSTIILQDQFNPNTPNAWIEHITMGGGELYTRLSDGTVVTGGQNSGPLVTQGGAGNDTISNIDAATRSSIPNRTLNISEAVRGGAGDDTITISHFNITNQYVMGAGDAGNDTLTGIGDGTGGIFFNNYQAPYEIYLDGGDGNDTLIAKSGNVVMEGGTGDDTFIWQSGKTLISDVGITQDGATVNTAIIDRANVSMSDFTFASGNFAANYSNDVKASLNGTSESIIFENEFVPAQNQRIYGGIGYETFGVKNLTFSYANAPVVRLDQYNLWQVGGTGNDTLSGQTVMGGDGNDIISGTSGDDVLVGGNGDDTLISSGGSDYLDGGNGNDTFIYSKPEVTDPNAPPLPPTSTQLVGGRGLDTFELHLTSTQFSDPAVLNDILLYQNFLASHTDTSTLHGASFTLGSLGVTASDMEAFKVFVDGIETSSIAPSANLPPNAKDDNFSVITGNTLSGNLLADNGNGPDTDPNAGQVLTTIAQTLTTADGGAVTVLANGNFSYASATGFTGQDSFAYTADDGFGGQSSATAHITVNATPNRNPVAINDLIDAGNKGTVTGNVMADNGHNGFGVDYDLDRDPLSVQAQTLTTANGGQVILNTDGSFTYQAVQGYVGSDSFNYTLQDNHGGTSVGQVSISNIKLTNLPPIAVNDAIDANHQAIVNGNVLTNDSDPDGDPLTVVAQNLTTANGGQIVLNANGSFTYQAATGFRGADSFAYTVLDNQGASAVGTVNLSNIFTNQSPAAIAETIDAAHSSAATGNVLTGNTDPDGDPLTAAAGTITTAGGNTATIAADGTVTVQAALGFRGNDSFAYTIQDPYGAQSSATVTVDNLFTNRAPVAVNDTIDANHQATASGNVLANDSDLDGDPLTAVAQNLTTANGGQVVLNANGSFTYQATTGFRGNDSFDYTVQDSYGASATATVSLSNIFTNHPPVAVNDTIDAAHAGSVSGNVLTNDSDSDGDTLTVTAQTLTTTNGDHVVLSTDGSFTYQAAVGYRGADSFTYTAQDSFGAAATATVNISNVFTNRAPVAVADTFDAANTATATGNVLTNDSDPDGDALSAVAQTLSTANGGTATISANGNVTYTAAVGYHGNDSFVYTVADGVGGTTTATVSVINIRSPGILTAGADQFDAANSATAAGNVLLNDNDTDGDTLSAVAQNFTTANGGAVTIASNGNVTYTAASGYNGSDSFIYTVSDGSGGSTNGVVNIVNIQANLPPVAQNDSFSGLYGQTITGNVLANDTDPDHDPLHVVQSSVTTVRGATVNIAANGAFSYINPEDFIGTDSFVYTAADGKGGTSSATVSLSVTVPTGAIVGTSGADHLTGTSTGGYILGLGGNDTIDGGSGPDIIYGGSGSDTIKGGSGADIVHSGSGNDVVTGGSGAMMLYGGDGLDTLTTGSGAATFVLEAATSYNNIDVFTNFKATGGNQSVVDIRDLMHGYTPGTSNLSDFVRAVNDGSGGSWLQVDRDGTGSAYGFQSVLLLQHLTNINVNTFVSNGNLLVA